MKIASIVLYVLFAATNIVRSSHHHFYREIRVDRSIEKILRSIVFQDVIISIRKNDIYDGATRLLDVVARVTSTTWPTQMFGLGGTRETRNLASSRTLLIYIYMSSNADITTAELNVLTEDVKLISYPKHTPGLLLIIGSSDGRTLTARHQLKYLWDKKFFNVLILEVSFRSKYSEPVFSALHSFNGFHDYYSRSTADIVDRYPADKWRNMHGNEFGVTFEDTRVYGSLNPRGDPDGLAKVFAEALSIAINATVVHTPFRQENDLTYDALALVYNDLYSTSYEHTVPFDGDRICLLTPVLSVGGLYFDFRQILTMVAIGLLLAAIVWCASLGLRVSRQVRDPLNTVSLFFSVSPLSRPRSPVEKILFVGVMITAAEYTILFQSELFEFAVEFTSSRRVSTFEELHDTELRVLVSPLVYRELNASGELPLSLMERLEPVRSFMDNQNKLDPSTALLLSETEGKLLEITYTDDQGRRRPFVLSDLCILSHYRAHTIPAKSLYKDDVDRVLLSLVEHGFVKKHLEKFWSARGTAVNARDKGELIPNDMSAYVAVCLILIGHGISLTVFIGELLIGGDKFPIGACSRCESMEVPKR